MDLGCSNRVSRMAVDPCFKSILIQYLYAFCMFREFLGTIISSLFYAINNCFQEISSGNSGFFKYIFILFCFLDFIVCKSKIIKR